MRLLTAVFVGSIFIGLSASASELSVNSAEKKTFVIGCAQDDVGHDCRAAQIRKTQQALSAVANIHFVYTDARGNTVKRAWPLCLNCAPMVISRQWSLNNQSDYFLGISV